jgi:chromosome segregation ATPase
LQERLVAQQDTVSSLEDGKQAVTRERDRLAREKLTLENRLQQKELELRSVNEQSTDALAKAQSEAMVAREELNRSRSRLERVQNDLNAANRQAYDKAVALADLQSRGVADPSQIRDLQNKLQEATARERELQEKVRNAESRANMMTGQTTKAKEQLQEKEREMGTLSQKLRELTGVQSQNEELLSRMADMTSQIDALQKEFASLAVATPAAMTAQTTETTTTQVKKENTMGEKLNQVKETIKTDANDAGLRIGAKQLTKLVQEPLAAVIGRHLGPDDESVRKKISDFMGTEAGRAITAMMLSGAISSIPGQNPELVQKLARELRVSAMVDTGDMLAEVLMGPLRTVMSLYLQGVPEVETERPSNPPELPNSRREVIDTTISHDFATANKG